MFARTPHSSSRAHRPLKATALTALLALTAAACESEVSGPDDMLVEGEITLDASNPATFAYLTFADGGSALTVADPLASTDWHIAFRRFSAKLNGGVAGPGDVAAVNLGNNAEATEEEVVAFTMVDADAAWEAVTVDDIAGVTFEEDGIVEDMSGPWFVFNPMTQTLAANSGAAWKARDAEGDYAVFRVVELVMNGNTPESVTVEFRAQADGGTLGDAQTVTVDFSMGPGHIDFSTGAVVAPSGCNWDLSFSPSFMVDFNGDCDAGSFPLDAAEDFAGIASASDAPEYGAFLSVISGAIPSTVDDASGTLWYNIEGNNRMWPTFNVFLVRIGTSVYKVQLLDYYDATGASGHPTLRFEQLQ